MRPRLFALVASMEARKLMSYRADFWISTIFTFAIQITVAYYLWRAIFVETGDPVIGGFTFRGMMLYYVLVALVGKFIFVPISFSGLFSEEIYTGSLNRFLVYPARYFTYKYAQAIGSVFPVVIQFALGVILLLLIVDLPPEVSITPQSVLMAVVSLWFANLLGFLIFAPFELLAFWADNVWSLSVMMRMVLIVLGGTMFPLTLFPEWAQEASRWLPFAYTFYYPVNTLMGRVGLAEWLIGIGVAVAWCVIMGAVIRAFWRRGMLRYTGVGI